MPYPIVSDGKGGVGDAAEAPQEAANLDYQKISPGFGGFASAFNQAENPVTSTLLPRAEQSQYREHDWFRDYINANAAMFGATDQTQYQPSPKLSAADANKRFPNPVPDGKPLFDQPIEEKLAESIVKHKTQQYQAETDMARFQMNNNAVTNFAASAVASMLDPINVATAFVPGLGEEMIAARGLGLAGRMALRAGEFGALSALQEAPIAGAKLAFADDLHSDYAIRDALKDMLMATGTGLVLGGVFGAGAEAWRAMRPRDLPNVLPVATANAETNHAAASSAVAQLITGRPVDVEGFFPKPIHTDTAIGLFTRNPFLERVESTELGLNRRDVAREIEPKIMRDFEAAEARKTAAASTVEALNKAAQPVASQTGELIQDQIERLESQLAGKLSKAKRGAAESKLADLREQFKSQGVPSNDELRVAQQSLQDADNHLRDMVAKISPVMQRADETMTRATAAATSQRVDDLLARQRQFMRQDAGGMLDREKAWRDSGLAPGIRHDDLVTAINEVANGAKAAPKAPIPETRPAGFAEPMTPEARATEHYDRGAEIAKAEGKLSTTRLQKEFGIGMPEAGRVRDQLIKDGVIDETGKIPVAAPGEGKPAKATTTAPKGGEAIAARPKSAAEAFPELDVSKLHPDEQAALLAAHDGVIDAENRVEAYQEAGRCLTGG